MTTNDMNNNDRYDFLDDPELTAYALGELDDAESIKRIEKLIADNDEARLFIDDIRATAGVLSDELGHESSPALTNEDEEAIAARAMEVESSASVMNDGPYPFPGNVFRSRWFKMSAALAAVAVVAITVTIVMRPTDESADGADRYAMSESFDNGAMTKEHRKPSIDKKLSNNPTPSAAEDDSHLFEDRVEPSNSTPEEKLLDQGESEYPEMEYRLELQSKVARSAGGAADKKLNDASATVKSLKSRGLAMQEGASYGSGAPATTSSAPASGSVTAITRGRGSVRGDVNNDTMKRRRKSGNVNAPAEKAYVPTSPAKEDWNLITSHLDGQGREKLNDQLSNEEYARLTDNPFLTVSDEPLSTFSVDVDTASYSIVRRYINQMAQIPPADAVRIEELINNFDYSYTAPDKDAEHPFAVHTEIAQCPWNPEHRLAKIGLKGYEVPMNDRPATNLVFLIDTSGSMRPANKLPLIQQSLIEMINNMTVDDRIAIVSYAGSSRLVLDSTSVRDKKKIIAAIQTLGARGSTNGAGGITQAYKVAMDNFIKDGVNRVILCTDGDFNVGVSNKDGLTSLIEEKRKTGVYLSVLGFGMGNYKDNKLETLADKGNGNYAYIDNYNEARKVLVERMAGTLVTIAKDVKLQIDFNPAQVSSYRLIGYENRVMAARDFNDDTKDAGEIGAGHTVTALYEIIPASDDFADADADANANADDVDDSVYIKKEETKRAQSGEMFEIRLRYKEPNGDKSILWTIPVKDADESLAQASNDFRFAAAVAEFGMILRGSPYRGDLSYAKLLDLAESGVGDISEESQNDRSEFVSLIKRAHEIAPKLFTPYEEPIETKGDEGSDEKEMPADKNGDLHTTDDPARK